MKTRLYLLGGNAAFDVTADEFVLAAGGHDARIALLLQGGRDWEKYVPEYTRPWSARGVSRYDVIVPDDHGRLNLDDVVAKLENATGIFIGGGNTAIYRRVYVSDPVRAILRKRYARGIPMAGCSAGALIAPKTCAFHPGESDGESLVAEGLGLVSDLLVGVHFKSDDVLPNLLAAMAASHTRTAWGIEETACVVLENEKFARVLGRAAYEIVMTDFDRKLYHLLEHPIP